jgi:hypothetical protein
MFRRSSEALALSEASLLALRPSLNTPVLNTDFLPVGPACAAIVVFAEEYGGIGLAIGVRSNEGGQIAVFRNQEPIDASTRITDALEPALATAERMGFLFDEDLIESVHEGQGRTQAMALWGGLMGELEMPVPPTTNELVGNSPDDSATSYSGLDATVPELLLDDVAPLESPEISLDLDNELQTSASGARPKPARQALSKFRNESPAPKENTAVPKDEPDEPGPETVDPGSTLGRIPLRRVRRGGSKRVPFLARLLSSF